MISISIIFLLSSLIVSSHYFSINQVNAIDENQTKQDITDLQIIASKVKMTMPGTNMTFGVPLENAKMHLILAEMDIKEGNMDGALMQLNFTSDSIKMHEKELADIVKMVEMVDTMNFTRN